MTSSAGSKSTARAATTAADSVRTTALPPPPAVCPRPPPPPPARFERPLPPSSESCNPTLVIPPKTDAVGCGAAACG